MVRESSTSVPGYMAQDFQWKFFFLLMASEKGMDVLASHCFHYALLALKCC